ncbi:MAG: hydroxysqualene dehydroxylase HpnE [Firmicutes bacterium]|nr:hydroxysqualene dehydroxylase HpnE [Bacillota bacterium]
MAAGDRLTGRVVVVGAGLAGLSAAFALSARGLQVTVCERSSRPGGRATSFASQALHAELDNGQHVLLGCCTRLQALLQVAGLEDAVHLQPLLDIPVYAQGRVARLYSRGWPGVLHLLPALVGYRHLHPAERMRALYGGARIAGLRSLPTDDESFATWLLRHGQSRRTIAHLWDLIVVSIMNGHCEQISARQALAALRTGVTPGAAAARLGYLRLPLGTVAQALARALVSRGVRLQYGASVERLEVERGQDGVCAVGVSLRANGQAPAQVLSADAVVLAVAHDAAGALLDGAARFGDAGRDPRQLAWSPICNVYALYDRPVWTGDVLARLDGVSQFVFNRGRLHGDTQLDGRLIAVSISAAQSLQGWTQTQIAAVVAEELCDMLPGARAARLIAHQVVWQRRATFVAAPGSEATRAGGSGGVKRVAVAGDWTATGWPASLEGAVRSGEAAAEAVAHMLQEEA